eukprot:scaffold152169_cov15-Tisochrysis_lutea.AAC.1
MGPADVRTAGFAPAKNKPAAPAEIKCACCEVCNYSGGKEPLSPLTLTCISVMPATELTTGCA